MNIELYKNADSPVEIPISNGVLQYDFAEFLVMRYNWPNKIRENLKRVSVRTLHHIANDIRMFLENLAHNNIHIQDATYEVHIKPILDELGRDWVASTKNIRYSRIRDYFEFLNSKGIPIKAIFPAKYVVTHNVNSDDDFYSHTRKSNAKKVIMDQGHVRTNPKEDYKEYVISMDTYGKLYSALKEIDPVYSVISEVMMLTMLRVHNVVQIPLRKSELNKRNWMLWPQFERSGKPKLKFNCISKGNKYLKVDVWPSAIQAIYKDYVELYYEERKDKFNNIYLKRKNASMEEYGVRLPDDVLWLNESGTPVKPSMVQDAFREASEQIGIDVTPHCMRHSGATHLLWNYSKLKGIEPNEKQAMVFHNVLKGILGHESVETTRMYIRTILNVEASLYIPKIQEKLRKKTDEDIDPSIRDDVEKRANLFYQGTVESIISDEKIVCKS